MQIIATFLNYYGHKNMNIKYLVLAYHQQSTPTAGWKSEQTGQGFLMAAQWAEIWKKWNLGETPLFASNLIFFKKSKEAPPFKSRSYIKAYHVLLNTYTLAQFIHF